MGWSMDCGCIAFSYNLKAEIVSWERGNQRYRNAQELGLFRKPQSTAGVMIK